MPELPEVETIRHQLVRVLPGQRIVRFALDTPKMLRGESADVRRRLRGQRVVAIGRRAKLLLIHLTGKETLLIHLKMTGQIIFKPRRGRLRVGGHPIHGGSLDLPNAYTRAVLTFASGDRLFFNDVRKFGYLRLEPTEQLDAHFRHLKLGVEPLDRQFTLERFLGFCRAYPRRAVYHLLMDQSLVAGLGNIYVNEVCFAARVRPTRRTKQTTIAERRALFAAIRRILPFAIRHRGTSLSDYRDAHGRSGGMEQYLKVYGRTGKPCLRRDGGIIHRVPMNGRSAFVCSTCQR